MKHLTRSVPALLLAAALVLMITGCDSLVETESTDVVHAGDVIADQAAFVKTGRTSTLDGKPILRLSEEELYSGRYTANIHKFIRLHGAQLLSELQNESIQGLSGDIQILNQADAEADFSTGASIPLAELFNRIDRKLLGNESSGGLEEPQAPSTHLEVVTNEETAEVYLTLSLLLTEEMNRSTSEEGRSFSFTDCSTIIIPTPECPEEIRFVSIDDPNDLIDVPDPGHVFVTATDIMDPSWTISLKVGQNGLVSVPSNVRVLTVKAEGIDQNIQAHSNLPLLVSGNTPEQQRYLALSKLRLHNAKETGAAEIVMSVQGTDNFSADYPNR